MAPSVEWPSDIGIVGAENACNFVAVVNTDRFFEPFGRGMNYTAFTDPTFVGEGTYLDTGASQVSFKPVTSSGHPLPKIETDMIAGLAHKRLVPASAPNSFYFDAPLPGPGGIVCNVYRTPDGRMVVQTYNDDIHYGPRWTMANGAVDNSDIVIDYEHPFPINNYILLGPFGSWQDFPALKPDEQQEALLGRYPDLNGPSFDCSGKLDPAAEVICRVHVLSRLDGLMGKLYPEAVAKDGSQMRDAQRFWLVTRDRACRAGDINQNDPLALRNLIECLNRFYSARISELAGIPKY